MTNRQIMKRLQEAIGVLASPYREKFTVSLRRLELKERRMYGADGFYLQWKESTNSVGQVSLHRLPQQTEDLGDILK